MGRKYRGEAVVWLAFIPMGLLGAYELLYCRKMLFSLFLYRSRPNSVYGNIPTPETTH
jgi:hypothetical protein